MESETIPAQRKPTLITAIIILAIVVAGIAGYFVWRGLSKTVEEKDIEALDRAAQGGVLPDINVVSNPAEELPTSNPIDQVNPFGKTYSNPFK